MQEHRILEGDRFQVVGTSSVAAELRARVVVEFDDGKTRLYQRVITTTADRVNTVGTFGQIEKRGNVVRATVTTVTPLKRGQCFVELLTLDRNLRNMDVLCQDYMNAGNNLVLGRWRSSLEGRGHLSWRTVLDDVAPAAATVEVLAVANARRKVYGFVWYYHRGGDAANVGLTTAFRAPGLSIPTGFSIAETVSTMSSSITLTANEEGIVYAMCIDSGDGFSSQNDNGSLTIDPNTTKGRPLPILVSEGDLAEISFAVSNGEAADRNSLFILQEEWIEV